MVLQFLAHMVLQFFVTFLQNNVIIDPEAVGIIASELAKIWRNLAKIWRKSSRKQGDSDERKGK
jgi:hypothetical protein